MVSRYLKIFSILFGIIIFVFMFFIFDFDFEQFIQTTKNVSPFIIILSFVIFLFYFPFYAYRAHIFTKYIGEISALQRVSYITFVSLALNYLTPFKLGIPSRIYLFKRFFNIPYSKNIIISFMELFTDIVAFSIVSFVGIFFIFTNPTYIILLSIMLLLLVSFFFFLFNPKLSSFFIKFLPIKIFDRVINFQKSVKYSTGLIYKLLTIGLILAIATLIPQAFMTFIIAKSFDVSISPFILAVVISISYLIGFISMVPGGIGVRDLSMTSLLVQVGVTPILALNITLIFRFITLFAVILIGTISYYFIKE